MSDHNVESRLHRDATRLAQVQMPNRNGFLLDDRPDTRAVRCMTNCK